MKLKNRFLGFCMISILVLSSYGVPQNIQKKIQKELEKFFNVSEITVTPIVISDTFNTQLPAKITKDNFFKLYKQSKHIGYAFVGEAPSKTATFDYLVIFDANLKVSHSKILIYREEYGGEIGSSRWLRQFLGKTIGDRVAFNDNIDGIAGATISVRSMTNSMDNLLQTMTILKNNKEL